MQIIPKTAKTIKKNPANLIISVEKSRQAKHDSQKEIILTLKDSTTRKVRTDYL